jgi:hypothetical protein
MEFLWNQFLEKWLVEFDFIQRLGLFSMTLPKFELLGFIGGF